MTQLDVLYRFEAQPAEGVAMALGRIREVYGIRRLTVDERAKTVRVEYDATRLTEPVVHQLLRRTGLDVVERVVLAAPFVPPPVEAVPAKA
ncbi:MAG: hypothetical protein V4555_15120 [Acidobacteriota bacterium]